MKLKFSKPHKPYLAKSKSWYPPSPLPLNHNHDQNEKKFELIIWQKPIFVLSYNRVRV